MKTLMYNTCDIVYCNTDYLLLVWEEDRGKKHIKSQSQWEGVTNIFHNCLVVLWKGNSGLLYFNCCPCDLTQKRMDGCKEGWKDVQHTFNLNLLIVTELVS